VRRNSTQGGRPSSLPQKVLTAGLIVAFLVVSAVAGFFVFDQVRRFIASSQILPDFTIESQEPEQVTYDAGQPLPRWEGTDRVNVLAMGIDQREHEQGPWRTDTLLVLTIDPVTMSAGMLSIPRDLWVPIPGFDEGRINTAHYLGELYDYPGGGPALAAETVQYNLGVPIHHYIRINFRAFEEMIDLIGGIDIYVEEDISDPTYPDRSYGYDPLYISSGWQHFNGEMALKYARTRHSGNGDFDRAKRQQQVLLAVFNQVSRLEMLPQLAAQAPVLWKEMEGSVVTDMTLDQVIALGRLAADVDPDNIRYGVIDENYTEFWTTPDGQEVLIPLRDGMRQLRDYIFTTSAELPGQETPQQRLEAEAATIEVLNGTAVAGLAASAQEYLQQKGLQIAHIDNADKSDYVNSLIIEYSDVAYTSEHIAQLLNLPSTAIVHGAEASTSEYDISIILGSDYQPPE